MVYADQIQEIVIAALSVASAIAACVLLLLNICIKHQRPALSLVAVLFTFVSGNIFLKNKVYILRRYCINNCQVYLNTP